MRDAIGEPREQIESGRFVFREDIAQICAIKDVFEGGKNANVNWRSVCAVNESVEKLLAMILHAPALPP